MISVHTLFAHHNSDLKDPWSSPIDLGCRRRGHSGWLHHRPYVGTRRGSIQHSNCLPPALKPPLSFSSRLLAQPPRNSTSCKGAKSLYWPQCTIYFLTFWYSWACSMGCWGQPSWLRCSGPEHSQGYCHQLSWFPPTAFPWPHAAYPGAREQAVQWYPQLSE